MAVEIHYAPDDLMQSLREANAAQPGKCFENCVIAVLGLRSSRKLRYALGFLTAPGHAPVAHAWLVQEEQEGVIYLDPTLQAASQLWRERRQEFIYEQRYTFTRAQLLEWFKKNYADRQLNELAIPEGEIRGPILNMSGDLK
jgi:hypothetical protein